MITQLAAAAAAFARATTASSGSSNAAAAASLLLRSGLLDPGRGLQHDSSAQACGYSSWRTAFGLLRDRCVSSSGACAAHALMPPPRAAPRRALSRFALQTSPRLTLCSNPTPTTPKRYPAAPLQKAAVSPERPVPPHIARPPYALPGAPGSRGGLPPIGRAFEIHDAEVRRGLTVGAGGCLVGWMGGCVSAGAALPLLLGQCTHAHTRPPLPLATH